MQYKGSAPERHSAFEKKGARLCNAPSMYNEILTPVCLKTKNKQLKVC